MRIVKKILWIILGALVLLIFLNLKNLWGLTKVYFSLKNSYVQFEEVINLFQAGKYQEAKPLAEELESKFSLASKEFNRISYSPGVKLLPPLARQSQDLRFLGQAAESLSKALNSSLDIMWQMDQVLEGQAFASFESLTPEKKAEILSTFYSLAPEISELYGDLENAEERLESVEAYGLLKPFEGRLDIFKSQLIIGREAIKGASVLSELVGVFSGYPEKSNFLFILQNNDELRATGGFIGTLGYAQVYLGEIVEMKTRDVYHLDMPAMATLKVEAPEALKKYLGVDNLYLRDSNWSPDFPTSARQILYFYKEEASRNPDSEIKDGPQEFTALIAITPRLITDLLYLVGPLEVAGKTYNKDNFVEILQHEVEIDYRQKGISEWDRKKVIGDIMTQLQKKIMAFPADKYPSLASTIVRNIEEKNLLLYFTDPAVSQVANKMSWGGEIKQVTGDYLMVVDSNLAAYKTDRVMDKKLTYVLEEKKDNFYGQVKLDYSHTGSFDWKTTRYRNYQRLYIPEGAWFEKIEGQSEGPEYLLEKFSEVNKKLQAAVFWSIEPGSQKKLSYSYRLNPELKDQDSYSLYLQKQAGNNFSEVILEFSFLREIKSYKKIPNLEVSGTKAFWQGKLDKDLSFFFNF